VSYTDEGGTIGISWGLQSDGGPRFAVTDTGVGIAPEHIPRLTERFYRVDQARSRELGGTGLGLAIVKHVLARHNGRLQVDSEPGKGSTFAFVFPPDRVRRRGAEASPRNMSATSAACTSPGADPHAGSTDPRGASIRARAGPRAFVPGGPGALQWMRRRASFAYRIPH